MRIEFNINQIDELSLGIFMLKGFDDEGEFNMVKLGFIIFEIDFIKYK